MDGEMPAQNQPRKNSFLSFVEIGVFEIIFVIVCFLLIFGTLNYFNILSVSDAFPQYLGWLPRQTNTASKQAETSIAVPTSAQQKNSLACPVPESYCNSGKQITYNGNPALAYNLPQGVEITAIYHVADSTPFVTQPYKLGNPIGFYQSFVFNNECYTATYTFSSTVPTEKINLLPLEKGASLATISADLSQIEGQNSNFILQLQKRQIDPKTANLPEDQRCIVTNLQPKDFGEYQAATVSLFK
ncbi:MAG: hypothetical protein M1524_00905 [Patescibacteria group bacterium]|nr:hypothetical protein [Patescibacteria group bacterium]